MLRTQCAGDTLCRGTRQPRHSPAKGLCPRRERSVTSDALFVGGARSAWDVSELHPELGERHGLYIYIYTYTDVMLELASSTKIRGDVAYGGSGGTTSHLAGAIARKRALSLYENTRRLAGIEIARSARVGEHPRKRTRRQVIHFSPITKSPTSRTAALAQTRV